MHIEAIDVDAWRVDDEHEIFPFGARDKKMLWSPNNVTPTLKQDWPYLFKQSRKSYPEQFWMEIIAWIVGEHMGIPVPKALPAFRRSDENKIDIVCGALLEWFYDPKSENFIHAGDYFRNRIPDFDDKLGSQHNLADLKIICRAHAIKSNLKTDWKLWVFDFLLFDCLIGNSDRHQENWGIVFSPGADRQESRLSPLFDNGTSLGHERFIHKVKNWDPSARKSYILDGYHHIRAVRSDPEHRLGHVESVELLLAQEASARAHIEMRLDFDFELLAHQIRNLCLIQIPLPLTPERAEWAISLLRIRYGLIKELLKK